MNDHTRNEVRLAAVAVVELVQRLGADPDHPEARLEELEAVLGDVDAAMVALHLAGVLKSVAETLRFPLDKLLAEMRSGVIGGG